MIVVFKTKKKQNVAGRIRLHNTQRNFPCINAPFVENVKLIVQQGNTHKKVILNVLHYAKTKKEILVNLVTDYKGGKWKVCITVLHNLFMGFCLFCLRPHTTSRY